MANDWEDYEGTPYPLGVTWIEESNAFNFSLQSKNAAAVRLLLYSSTDQVRPLFEYAFDYLVNKSGPIWHCTDSEDEASKAAYYAFQIDGPTPGSRSGWHAFDAGKILLDPRAHSVFFPADFSRDAACRPGSNAGRAPLGVVPSRLNGFDWHDDIQSRHGSDLVIYELHVRGFTRSASSDVCDSHRGTFLGVIDRIPYLLDLGVTAVELMPVFQFDPDDDNYWGYMPLNFFSPHHAYASDRVGGTQQVDFCEMVKALHAVGIEVILDVVYNHTCESDRAGPTYSFKGIDAA